MGKKAYRTRHRAAVISLILIFLLAAGCGDDKSTGGGEDETLITIQISSSVHTIQDTYGVLTGHVELSDVISGTYLYDSTTEDNNALATVGDYWHYAPPYGIFLTFQGGLSIGTNPLDVEFIVEISNDHSGSDGYLLRSYNNISSESGFTITHISWQLDDATATAVSSIELTTEPPTLADWTSIFGLTVTGHDTSNPSHTFMIRGTVSLAEKVTD